MFLFMCAPDVVHQPDKNKALQHYELGLWHLRQDSIRYAARQFHKAITIDSTYASAWSGLALILAMHGHDDKAHQYLDKSFRIQPTADAFMFKGRLLLMQHEQLEYEKAIKAFNQALALQPGHELALYYKALALKETAQLDQAVSILETLNRNRTQPFPQSDSLLNFLRRIQQEHPVSDVGVKIALQNKITRAAMAVLLDQEINMDAHLKQQKPIYYSDSFQGPIPPGEQRQKNTQDIADIQGHWAKSSIRKIINLGLMDIFPDQTFRPDLLLKRRDAAVIYQNILVHYFGEEITTRYINKPSLFPDVERINYAYNAIFLVYDVNIMHTLDQSERFYPNKPLSGYHALRSAHQLKEVLNSLSNGNGN